MQYILGIDAGGTKTRARLTDRRGQVIGNGLSGAGNIGTDIDTAYVNIMQAANQAMTSAGLDVHDTQNIWAGLGIAGASRPQAREALRTKGLPFGKTVIDHDAAIANLGAHGGTGGGVVIVGTGSIAYGVVDGREVRIGGYGFPISDQGSGASIGLTAMQLTLQAADGRIAHTALTQDLFVHFDTDIQSVISWMDTAKAKDYAALMPIVLQAANADDAHGRALMQNAAGHIERLIKGLQAEDIERCALLGGLADSMTPWLSEGAQKMLIKPKGDALDGALWLAKHRT